MQPAALEGLPSARKVGSAALARGLRPPRRRTVAQWAAERRVVSPESGSRFPGPWSNALTPHLVEPMECLTPAHPARSVVFKKAHQTAFSESGLNLIGHIIEDDPSPILVVLPTTDEVKKYVKTKLQPMIDATPSVKERVREQKSRDEEGSTTTFKKFEGGFLQVTGANSSSGLKMISVRVTILEEVTEYPDDVDNQGDPVDLALKRMTTWEGYEKAVYISTPGIKGSCRISAKYELSDQRVLYLPCPHCGVFQPLRFERLDKVSAAPVYACAAHGCVIEHSALRQMLRLAVWIKTYPGDDKPPETITPEEIAHHRARDSAGRDPGFFFNALSSPFMSWIAIVKQWREAQNNHAKLKVFTQQVLGEAWEAKGDAPDHQRLFEKRSAYPWRQVPRGALFTTGAADVQGNRIEWAVYAWGPALTSWLIDKGVIEGDPSKPEPWKALDEVVARTYPDGFGRPWKIDAFGVDTGFLTQVVYRFARRYAGTNRVFALDGRPGWKLPALGTPQKKDVDFEGKKIGAILLWPVGTWDLKSELYSALANILTGPDKVTGLHPPGTCFYGEACDLAYLEQLTSEQLMHRKDKKTGRTVQVWEVLSGRRNEAHDIAVYARALAHHIGDGLSPAQWAELASHRGAKPEDVQRDLEALWAPPVAVLPEQSRQTPIQKVERVESDWLGDTKNWIN